MLGRLVGWIATTFDRAESAREGRRRVEEAGEPYHQDRERRAAAEGSEPRRDPAAGRERREEAGRRR